MDNFKVKVGNVTVSGGGDWHLQKFSITVKHGNRPVYVVAEKNVFDMIDAGQKLCEDIIQALDEVLEMCKGEE